MNSTVIGVGVILMLGGIAGHFNRYPGDFKIIVSGVKDGLSRFSQWFITGDKEVVYPVALIIGFSLAVIASWLRY